jgi:hypothetical protein
MSRIASRLAAATALCLCVAALSASARQPAGYDIVGIRLGMTEQEARAAVQAHDPSMQLRSVSQTYRYSDGAREHNTAASLARIEAHNNKGERIVIGFAMAPNEPRVLAVSRSTPRPEHPPTQAQLEQALVAKYGPPFSRYPHTSNTMLNIAWAQADKPNCWAIGDKDIGIPTATGGTQGIVQWIGHRQQRGRAPKDISTCGAAVNAMLSGEPVHGLVVNMTDLGAAAVAEQKTSAWVEAQRQSAMKERLAKGQGPKL